MFCCFCVFVSDLLQIEQYVVGSLLCEFVGMALEGGGEGGRSGEGAFFGNLRHSAFEFEEEGGEEIEF